MLTKEFNSSGDKKNIGKLIRFKTFFFLFTLCFWYFNLTENEMTIEVIKKWLQSARSPLLSQQSNCCITCSQEKSLSILSRKSWSVSISFIITSSSPYSRLFVNRRGNYSEKSVDYYIVSMNIHQWDKARDFLCDSIILNICSSLYNNNFSKLNCMYSISLSF